ncbi:MAG TPA: methyltransferase domain-containing protein [Calidithermus sp.]|nr:methyltransferase domain-containing protein [Calidithermus sp.]
MNPIDRHYGRPTLHQAILDGLRAVGKDPECPTPEDLAPVDHFHIRGREATLELARQVGLGRGTRVLDVGGGIGGPARALAREFGCRVMVVDITEEFCRVGADLTRRTGLADRVEFHVGDALELPFADGAFDVAWTQHATMNIPDKAGLYRTLHRVVRPGGRLAMHEIVAGAAGPVHFPVPWARDPSISHLRGPADVHALLAGLGFQPLVWQDQTEASLAWFRERLAVLAAEGPPPLGVHLMLGPDAPRMFANMVRNLEEDRVRVVMAVWERA